MSSGDEHGKGPALQRPALTMSARLVGVVVGLAAAVSVMLLAFALPSSHSGAHDLPLAVSGPSASVQQLTAALDKAHPGAFEVTTYSDGAAVSDAIESRDAIGGISVTSQGVTIRTASAAGAPYGPLLHTVGAALQEQNRTPVTYADVVPYTQDDPTGASFSALGLPLAFGGMISAVVLSTLFRDRIVLRVVGSISFAILAGLSVTAILQFWIGSVDGSYWLTAASLSLGVAAISLTVLGLESLLGYAGLGVGAVLMMFVSNPLSGISTGSAWLPDPWGTVGQLLPIGAAGDLVRSTAFFDGAGGARPVAVLGIWALLGLFLMGLSRWRKRATQPSTDQRELVSVG